MEEFGAPPGLLCIIFGKGKLLLKCHLLCRSVSSHLFKLRLLLIEQIRHLRDMNQLRSKSKFVLCVIFFESSL